MPVDLSPRLPFSPVKLFSKIRGRSLAGIPMGKVMHRYIMGQVEMDYIMFGRSLSPLHVLYSIVLTLLFGLLVNRMMANKLKKITMVESLKSVE